MRGDQSALGRRGSRQQREKGKPADVAEFVRVWPSRRGLATSAIGSLFPRCHPSRCDALKVGFPTALGLPTGRQFWQNSEGETCHDKQVADAIGSSSLDIDHD